MKNDNDDTACEDKKTRWKRFRELFSHVFVVIVYSAIPTAWILWVWHRTNIDGAMMAALPCFASFLFRQRIQMKMMDELIKIEIQELKTRALYDDEDEESSTSNDTSETHDETVERIAQTIYHHGGGLDDDDYFAVTGTQRRPWKTYKPAEVELSQDERDEYRVMARAVLESDEETSS